MNKKRKFFDFLRNFSTYISSSLFIITFVGILAYIFITGSKGLTWNLISSNYKEEVIVLSAKQDDLTFSSPELENNYFSYKYGISLKDGTTNEGNKCIYVTYIATGSQFNNANDNKKLVIGNKLDSLIGISFSLDDVECYAKEGAKVFAEKLDQCQEIVFLKSSTNGGGIKGSLLATLYLIGLTLLFALPLGIGGSIYLTLYAKEGLFKEIITNMIDATSGIPSIIFGFVGLIVFIPFVSMFTHGNNFSILAGALTMSIVLLPTIVKTTSEALREVPKSYMQGSLALGTSKTQTIFKVIIPNALPGILTSIFLSIGRIIGESSALMFVMGTSIEDNISIFKNATSLSLHIWSLTKQEVPNYQIACSISIIILIVVFLMNFIVKMISYRIKKKKGI